MAAVTLQAHPLHLKSFAKGLTMFKNTILALLGLTLSFGVAAQTGVTESTDPARAAAVEKAVRDLQARAARDAQAGNAPAAFSVVRGVTSSGLSFLSGGITVGDRVSMHAARDRYTLWVATVAKPSGAYLTEADLRIVDRKTKAIMLEQRMDGPWFLVALPPGQYEVTSTLKPEGASQPQTLTKRVQVPVKGLRQAVFRFDSTVEVGSEMDSPFKGNPFGPPAVK